MLTRRAFTAGLAAAGSAGFGLRLGAAQPAHVVIVGAGVAGLACARALGEWLPSSRVRVSLIEPEPLYRAPFGSSRILTGQTDSHHHGYRPNPLTQQVRARVSAIDPDRHELRIENQGRLRYDLLVVAPGLVPAEGQAHPPPAGWFNDDSFTALRRRLDALEDGASIALACGHLPYRCPPAPYERAGLIAHYLGARGLRDVHISILDAKEGFSMQAHLLSYWEKAWPGQIEWLPPSVHDGIEAITDTEVITGLDSFKADLVLSVDQQQAPAFCREAGLADFTGLCPIDPANFRSRRLDDIYVIGDAAAAHPMPKAASAAMAQARLAARDIASRLDAEPDIPAIDYQSQCFVRLNADQAISSLSQFELQSGELRQIQESLSPHPLDAAQARQEMQAAEAWYQQTIRDLGLRV